MSAYSPGGHSIYSDDDYYSASYAGQIINQSGVKEFSPTDLQKLLAGKTASASPYINELTEGFSGSAAPKDVETLFQLVYLYFTEPRHDEGSFQSFKTRNAMLFQNLMSNPQFYFQDQLSKIMTQNHPRGSGFPTIEELDKIDFERAYEIYKERFGNAGDFIFVFVGNFEIDKIKPLINTYLASLPNTSRNETWKDLGIRSPNGVVDKTIQKGTDPKSLVAISFTGDFEYNTLNNYRLNSLGELLNNRLIDIIREEKSGVYTVNANGSGSLYPVPRYSFSINFPCGPDNVEKLVDATMEEIENIKKNGVTEEDLKKVKEAQRLNHKENLKNNRYWLNQLRNYYYLNRDFEEFDKFDGLVESLKAKDIQDAANKYLSGENVIKVILLPEG